MRVLAVTKIFPNRVEPTWGPYNRQQFAALAKRCELEVLATIPWVPGIDRWAPSSSYAHLAPVPARDIIDGLAVRHPRTYSVPRFPGLGSPLYAASLLPVVLPLRGRVDVILAAWAHPDGAAAVLLGKLLGAPTVVKLHGSDVNTVGQLPGPRRAMRLLLPRAERIVAVSRALGDAVCRLGVSPERVDVVLNGVDGDTFRVRPRAPARARLGLDPARRLLLYVGRVEETKGALDLVHAFAEIARTNGDIDVVLVGDGSARAAAEGAAASAGLGARVTVTGLRPLPEVAEWMAACDALVLPSWAEGTPNVLLEALACGRRVVATTVGGCPDVVARPELGLLVPPKDPRALAPALAEAARVEYDPEVVARLGSRGGWDESAARLFASLERAITDHRKEHRKDPRDRS